MYLNNRSGSNNPLNKLHLMILCHSRKRFVLVKCALSFKMGVWAAAQIEPADAAAISGWIVFVEQLGGAYLAAVRRWVEAHAAAAEGAGPKPSPAARTALDALPGPRLLCDNLFTSEMREVLQGLALHLNPTSFSKSSSVHDCLRAFSIVLQCTDCTTVEMRNVL